MKVAEYKKLHEKSTYANSSVLMFHPHRKDVDGDLLYKTVQETLVKTFEESGWLLYKKETKSKTVKKETVKELDELKKITDG